MHHHRNPFNLIATETTLVENATKPYYPFYSGVDILKVYMYSKILYTFGITILKYKNPILEYVF